MIIDKRLMHLIRVVEIGYEMFHNEEIDTDTEKLGENESLTLYSFDDIGLEIHTSVRFYGLTQ